VVFALFWNDFKERFLTELELSSAEIELTACFTSVYGSLIKSFARLKEFLLAATMHYATLVLIGIH